MTKSHRVTVTLDDVQYERLRYWADKHQCSINEYLKMSIDNSIDNENRNYNLPALEIQRLNQLIDTIVVLSENTKALESVVVNGFDSLLSLTRGDNYLLDSEDGDL